MADIYASDSASEGGEPIPSIDENSSSTCGKTQLSGEGIIVRWNPGLDSIGDAVCAIGAFDGVHKGHRYLIDSMIADARAHGVPAVVVTFDPDPDELFCPVEKIKKILDNEDRLAMLGTTGVDYVLAIPFVPETAGLSYCEFLEQTLGAFMTPRAIHVGSDFHLGSKAAGNVELIGKWGETRRCVVHPYKLLCEVGEPITATRIRGLIEAGDIAGASELLGRAHYVRGRVVAGRGAGRDFGWPTANIEVTYPYVIPGDAVYGGYVIVTDEAGERTKYPAAISVGVPPTFADATGCIEAHLIGFVGDLYGREVEVLFVERLRDMKAFDSTEELIETVNSNIKWVCDHL